MMLRISTCSSSASCQWVMSVCHVSFGRSAWKRISELRPLLWLGSDQSLPFEDSPDRCAGGNVLHATSKVVGDRRCPAIVAFCLELAS